MENGEWIMENGEWRMENGTELLPVFNYSTPVECEKTTQAYACE